MTRPRDDDPDQHHCDEQREKDHTEGGEPMVIPLTGEAAPAATDEPPPAPPGKHIHRRRPLPPVPEKDDSE